MSSSSRLLISSSVLGVLAVGVLGGISSSLVPALAQSERAMPTFDTSGLPRLSGAKIIYESPSTTIMTVAGSVPEAADAATALLAQSGWVAYVAPATEVAKSDQNEILTFKKGKQGLSVFVSIAPAYANATSVHYTANYLEQDLPFAPDATTVEFAPERPFVRYTTKAPVDQALDYFEREILREGWTRWAPAPGQTEPSNAVSDTGAHVFFVRDQGKPMLVAIERIEGKGTALRAEPVPPKLLLPKEMPEPQADASAAAPEAPASPPPAGPDVDKLARDIMKGAESAVEQALAEAFKPTKPKAETAKEQGAGDSAGLTVPAMTDVAAGLPLPATAEQLEIGDGDVSFRSATAVATLAGFYRDRLAADGWTLRPSVINRDTMVVLQFEKSGEDLTLTLMRMGPATKVMARGSGLKALKGKSEAAQSSAPDAGAEASADPKLEVAETGGLPVPKPNTLSGHETTPYRVVASATVSASLNGVLAFYRAELKSRGWTEVAAQAVVKEREAALSFASPEGPALLSLSRKDDATEVLLEQRKPKAAAAAGILPKAGRVKVMFGNAGDGAADVTIDGKTIAIAAGVGSKNPDGPTVDLKPGSYKVGFKIKGGAEGSETVDVKADEAWGILLGPGGALPLRMY